MRYLNDIDRCDRRGRLSPGYLNVLFSKEDFYPGYSMLLTDDLLLNFKRCERRAFLTLYGNPAEKSSEKDFLVKLRKENQQQITAYLGQRPYSEPQSKDWETRAKETVDLMAAGTECIYKGILLFHLDHWDGTEIKQLTLVGKPTVLLRQSGESR